MRVCDRCGKKLVESSVMVVFIANCASIVDKQLDLCEKCGVDFLDLTYRFTIYRVE